jgi:hypothetical protein
MPRQALRAAIGRDMEFTPELSTRGNGIMTRYHADPDGGDAGTALQGAMSACVSDIRMPASLLDSAVSRDRTSMAPRQQVARVLRGVARRLDPPPGSRRPQAPRPQDAGAFIRGDSAPASRTPSSFFEQFPRFYETSRTAATAARLNLRYQGIIGENRDILDGASVLDLASHDGRWSLAALAAGARSVTGIEARPELVRAATETLGGYGYGADRARFVTGDVHEVLNTQDFGPDVVLCLGFLYHTLRYNELLHGVRRTNARYLIIDTFSPYMMQPVPNANVITEHADEQGRAVADTYTRGPSVLVGRPNLAAIQTMLGVYGYRVERLSDWAGILRDNPRTGECDDYADGKRVTVRCVIANAAPAYRTGSESGQSGTGPLSG